MLMTAEERAKVETLSTLARCNPFLPERKAHERAALGDAFEDVSPVWSKHLDRHNPNVVKIAARAEPLMRSLEKRQSNGRKPTEEEHGLIEEVVFYLLYGRFKEAFEQAMSKPDVAFYGDFAKAARDYLPSVSERVLPHWFAFLFQVRRASYYIFDFVVGKSLPAARLRGAIWQSIFTHDLRRYRRALFDKMGDVATLITGPSGTGKEIVARAIGLSRFIPFEPRRKRFVLEAGDTFFSLNLSALAPTIIESELFGHRRGAFTGALTDRKGWLALCPPLGTVFLDEIGEVDPTIQVKLLRVLQTREFQPIGDTKTQAFAGKIVAATNRDLATEMTSGRFREDLYYRLCSDLITTPSLKEQLRDTPDDLNDLVRFIARRVVGKEESETVTTEVLEWIESHLERNYAWPGNVRELEQCVRNIVIRNAYRPAAIGGETNSVVDLDRAELSAEELLSQYCAVVYARTGSYVDTARKLGLDRRTVKSKVEAFHRRRPSTTG